MFLGGQKRLSETWCRIKFRISFISPKTKQKIRSENDTKSHLSFCQTKWPILQQIVRTGLIHEKRERREMVDESEGLIQIFGYRTILFPCFLLICRRKKSWQENQDLWFQNYRTAVSIPSQMLTSTL